MKKIFLIGTIALLVISMLSFWQCSQETANQSQNIANQSESHEEGKKHQEHNEEKGHQEEEQIVNITPEEMKEFDIELATAGPGELQIHVNLPGEVVIPPDNIAHVHPRFPGIVKKVLKHIGDRVKKGETLAIVESNESLVEYKIKSLIDGTVVEKHLTVGEVVDDTQHGFVIADLDTVWVYLQVYQKDLPYVNVGQKVTIIARPGMPQATAYIDYISPIVDEVTRTAKARVILPNPKGIWKPGLFVTGRVITKKVKVNILVPKTALQTMGDQTVVFVKTDEGYKPQPVEVGRENEVNVEILHGLKPGQVYVSKGGFTLKSELLKSEIGEGHGH